MARRETVVVEGAAPERAEQRGEPAAVVQALALAAQRVSAAVPGEMVESPVLAVQRVPVVEEDRVGAGPGVWDQAAWAVLAAALALEAEELAAQGEAPETAVRAAVVPGELDATPKPFSGAAVQARAATQALLLPQA